MLILFLLATIRGPDEAVVAFEQGIAKAIARLPDAKLRARLSELAVDDGSDAASVPALPFAQAGPRGDGPLPCLRAYRDTISKQKPLSDRCIRRRLLVRALNAHEQKGRCWSAETTPRGAQSMLAYLLQTGEVFSIWILDDC